MDIVAVKARIFLLSALSCGSTRSTPLAVKTVDKDSLKLRMYRHE